MVLAEDSPAAGEGVLVELPGLLDSHPACHRSQAELAGRGEGVGVVVAQDPAPPGQDVLVQEFPGLLVLAQTRTGRWRVGWPR